MERHERIIRVLHLLAPAAEGGLETVVRLLAGAAASAQVEAGILVLNQVGGTHPFTAAARAAGLGVAEIPSGRRRYLAEADAVARALKDGRWDLLHTHGYHADLVGRIAARRAGVPVVTTAHGITGGDWKNRLYEWLQRRAWRGFDAVIAVSAPLAERLLAAGVPRDRLVMIRNAWQVHPVMERAAARAALGVPADGRRLGFIGRLSAEKGPDLLLDALAALPPDVTLSVIGTGPLEPALRARAHSLGIAGRVTWHGPVPGAAGRLAAFDAVVLSSRTEGTPMVLFEAMNVPVPVVATRVGGVPDVVGDCALLAAPDAAELAEAIRRTLDDPAGSAARAAASRQRLAEAFGAAAWLTQHRNLYAPLLARAGARR